MKGFASRLALVLVCIVGLSLLFSTSAFAEDPDPPATSSCDPSLLAGVVDAPGTVSIVVDAWHGGWCQVCDQYADYQCFGSGGTTFAQFADPVPPGKRVTRITATLMGLGCGSAYSSVSVAGMNIGSGNQSGSCACGDCSPLTLNSATYPNGFPGYAYGGSNQLAVNASGTLCLSYVRLTFQYDDGETIPPVTTATTYPTPIQGWNNNNATVTLSAMDAGSGVQAVYYRINGGTAVMVPGAFATVPVSAEGTTTIGYWAVDKSGNVETTRTHTVKIDKTNPSITASATTADAAPYTAGAWTAQNVTVTFSCSDTGSGVSGCSPPVTVGIEGAAQLIPGYAYDVAGNQQTVNLGPINIDRTRPTIIATAKTADGAPYTGAWTNQNVTVSFTCADAGSGIASCPAPVTVSAEGGGQSVSSTAVDAVGNQETVTFGDIAIDKTSPMISASAKTAGGAAYTSGAWTAQEVVVRFECADGASGVASCPGDVTITSEGAGQSASGTVTDTAGNQQTATFSGINVDRTRPTITASATSGGAPYTAGTWTAQNVTVSFTCSDAASGLASCPSPVTVSADGAGQSASGTAVDAVGNQQTVTFGGIDIDKSLPTIAATARLANDSPYTSGVWTNQSVVLSFTCADGVSGVASCPAEVTVSTEGAGQSVSGTVFDLAGNTRTVTFSGINIDKTAPNLSATASSGGIGSYSGGDWTNHDVVVHFDCDDAASGVATCPADVTVSTEGAGQSVSGTMTDLAGNQFTLTFDGINVDKTPPTITASATAGSAPFASGSWTDQDVVVHFTCADEASGVALCSADQTFSEGAGQAASGAVTDAAGNQSTVTFAGINVDKTAPTIAATATTADGAAYTSGVWTNQNVIVHFECADDASGVATCPGDVAVSAEGASQSVSGTVTDAAGNQRSATFAGINVDKTAPTIAASATAGGAPYSSGAWTKHDVTVAFSCADEASGVSSCPAGVTVPGEGAGQSVSGTVMDAAGNQRGIAFDGINIDKTLPAITASAKTADGAAYTPGVWTNQNVIVHFECADDASGVATCPAEVTVSAEGANQQVSGTVTDVAGNQSGVSFDGISVDKTLPTIAASAKTADGAAYTSGVWTNQNVIVSFSCGDDASGVTSCPSPITVTTEGAGQSVLGTAADAAGNQQSVTFGGINVDKTKPATTAAVAGSMGNNGWFKAGAQVQLALSASDNLAGIASIRYSVNGGAAQGYSAPVSFSDGVYTVEYEAIDGAGNAGTLQSISFKVDQTAPAVAIGGVTNGGSYTLGAVPSPTYSVTDGGSGIDSQSATLVGPSTPSSAGAYTYTANAADKAGNSTVAVANYVVIYNFGGFLQPVIAPTTTFKAGSAIPVKFQLLNANGATVDTAAATLAVSGAAAQGVGKANTGDTLRYDASSQQYVFNLSTKGMSAGSLTLAVALDDGTTRQLTVTLK